MFTVHQRKLTIAYTPFWFVFLHWRKSTWYPIASKKQTEKYISSLNHSSPLFVSLLKEILWLFWCTKGNISNNVHLCPYSLFWRKFCGTLCSKFEIWKKQIEKTYRRLRSWLYRCLRSSHSFDSLFKETLVTILIY